MNGTFENIWIQPAAGDAGGALGSTYNYWYSILGKEKNPLYLNGSTKGFFTWNRLFQSQH